MVSLLNWRNTVYTNVAYKFLEFKEKLLMSTSFIAFLIAVVLVIGLVVSVGGLSLFLGAFDSLLGKPKLTFLKSEKGNNGLAFHFRFNGAKEEAPINVVKVRLFNPFGTPTHIEVAKKFDDQKSSFAIDLDMGPAYINLLGAKGFEKATVQIELGSKSASVFYQYDMKALKFSKKITDAEKTVTEYQNQKEDKDYIPYGANIAIPQESMIADTVPGKGAQLALPTNPAFEEYFQSLGGGGDAGAKTEQENFSVSKVWIEPGCIVCDACETIFPEVFEVTADTCIIRPDAPLDDGLRVEEAAEACPVEVIKYTKAS